MSVRILTFSAAIVALLMVPALAERHGGHGSSETGPAPGAGTLGRIPSGRVPHITPRFPRGAANPSWGEFHRNAPAARVHPHRYGSSVLPTPNRWHGDVGRFDRSRWSHGGWHHERHNGRLGWWWVVGPDWYFFDFPVYPYPDAFYPPDEPTGWWFWCPSLQEYYPYVTNCPGGWERVLPRD